MRLLASPINWKSDAAKGIQIYSHEKVEKGAVYSHIFHLRHAQEHVFAQVSDSTLSTADSYVKQYTVLRQLFAAYDSTPSENYFTFGDRYISNDWNLIKYSILWFV